MTAPRRPGRIDGVLDVARRERLAHRRRRAATTASCSSCCRICAPCASRSATASRPRCPTSRPHVWSMRPSSRRSRRALRGRIRCLPHELFTRLEAAPVDARRRRARHGHAAFSRCPWRARRRATRRTGLGAVRGRRTSTGRIVFSLFGAVLVRLLRPLRARNPGGLAARSSSSPGASRTARHCARSTGGRSRRSSRRPRSSKRPPPSLVAVVRELGLAQIGYGAFCATRSRRRRRVPRRRQRRVRAGARAVQRRRRHRALAGTLTRARAGPRRSSRRRLCVRKGREYASAQRARLVRRIRSPSTDPVSRTRRSSCPFRFRSPSTASPFAPTSIRARCSSTTCAATSASPARTSAATPRSAAPARCMSTAAR